MLKRFRKTLQNRSGFSFVELIAVLIIIAILASIGVPIYLQQVKTARAADAQSTIAAIKTAHKMYRQKYGKVPNDLKELERKKLVSIDNVTQRNWKFDITNSRDDLKEIMATSTEHMPGGAGERVVYDAETGVWTGYGQDEEE